MTKKILGFLNRHFYRNIPYLNWLGIFVLGDIIILLPFIIVSLALIWLWQGWLGVIVFWCVFMGLRHFFEVIYWLLKQAVRDTYRPPFPGPFSHDKVHIIYQLTNFCWLVLYTTILIFILSL